MILYDNILVILCDLNVFNFNVALSILCVFKIMLWIIIKQNYNYNTVVVCDQFIHH